MILHIDMDAFFASIEQAINPRLRGKPLIVGSRGNKYYTVVAAASYEAKRMGIDSGMPTKEALKICPQAEFVSADSGRYIWTSEAIHQMLFHWDPNPLYASVDEFQLDVTNQSLEASESQAREIKKAVKQRFNITCSVGIAKNFLLAKLASKLKKPDGLFIISEENLRPVLKNLCANQLCGVGPSTEARLNQLGIYNLWELYNTKQELLNLQLGKLGYELFWSLRNHQRISPFERPEAAKSIGHSYTLPRAEKSPKIVLGWLRLLAEMVASRLRNKALEAKKIHLAFAYSNGAGFNKQKTFSQATNDGFEITSRCLKIWPKWGQFKAPIRFLSISTGSFQIRQKSLLKEVNRREELLASVDRINAKFGDWTIYPARVKNAKD